MMASTGSTAENITSPSPFITEVKPFLRYWAKGSRSKWLESHISPYTSARNRGAHQGTEYAASVAREFRARYPWYLRMDVEPTDAHLCQEVSLPLETLSLKKDALERLDAAIPKWLAHRYSKADPICKMTKKQISTNPVAAILAKVGDVNVNDLQRARTPEQLWSKTVKAEINEEFNLWFASSGLAAKTQRAAARQKWVDKHFMQLDKEEQKHWKKVAEEEKERRASAKEAGKEPLHLLDPVECQKALDGIAGIMQPLLEGLHESLGGNIHFFWAGPEPARGGQVNVISLHVGNDKSETPQPFDTASGARGQQRRKFAEAAIGEFAMECYSLEEQESRALPGISMSRAAPSFLRQPLPWNTIGGQDFATLPASSKLPMSPTTTNGSTVALSPREPAANPKKKSTSAVLKRKRGSKGTGTARKRARKTSKDGEEVDSTHDDKGPSDDEEEEEEENQENVGSGAANANRPGLSRKNGRLTRSRTALDDITNLVPLTFEPPTFEPPNLENDIPIDPALMYDIPTNGPLDSPAGPDTTSTLFQKVTSSRDGDNLPPSSSSSSGTVSTPPSPCQRILPRSDLAHKLLGAPTWLSGAVGIPWFQTLGLGAEFGKVLDALVDLEAAHGFNKKKPLPPYDIGITRYSPVVTGLNNALFTVREIALARGLPDGGAGWDGAGWVLYMD